MSDTPQLLALMQKTREMKAYDCVKEFESLSLKFEKENIALRNAAVDVCILARVWVTVWGDKLSTESIQRFVELEKQILKEAQP